MVIRSSNGELGSMRKNEGDRVRLEAEMEAGRGLKKGPWTAAEDTILNEYVKNHGEGNWNAVQKNTGLARCGKSCRLRWANHLRPNLKKGGFTPDEERLIIELHAKFGNKWARMAAHLPGRTDNEIKNYWNTRMKRRQRAGLPLYPQEVQQGAATYHLQQSNGHHQYLQNHQGHDPSPSSFSSLPSSSSNPHKSNYNNLVNYSSSSALPPLHNHPQDHSDFYSNPISQLKGNEGNFGQLPLSPVSPFEPYSSTLFTHNLPTLPMSQQPLHMMNYGNNIYGGNNNYNSNIKNNCSLSATIMTASGSPYDQALLGLQKELPSIQTPPNTATTPARSGSSCGDGVLGVGSSNTDHEYDQLQRNSGLLDDILIEAKAISRNEKPKDEPVLSSSTKDRTPVENQSDYLSSSQSSIVGRKRPREEGIQEETESMFDDLMSLLNFPAAVSIPDWYRGGSDKTFNWQSSNVCDDNLSLITKQIDATSPRPSDASRHKNYNAVF